MKKKVADIKRFGLLLIGAIAMLCSCRDEVYPGSSPDSEEPMDIVINLKIKHSGNNFTASRSVFDPDPDKENEYLLGFTPAESAIDNLTLFMMKVDDDGSEEFEVLQTVQATPSTDLEYDYEATFTLTGYTGVKHFYLGANMNPNHINAFRTGNRVFDAGEEGSGHNIVGSLMEIDHNTGGNGAGSNIVMTGIVTDNDDKRDIYVGRTDADIKEGQSSIQEINASVNMVRTVAKVLLTCVPKPGSDEGYVNVVDAKDAESNSTGNTGWIQFDHVNYMLNVLNRKTYLDYREEEDENGTTYLVDPNYKMSELIGPSESGTYGIKDLAAYRKEFLYYDTQQMVEMLNTDVQEREEKSSEPCITRQATVYDVDRVGANNATSTNHYTEGLYCTENMVYRDGEMQDIPDADFQSANRYVTTRIMIGAKYTPKKIWMGDEQPQTFDSETGAMEALSGQEDTEDNPGGPVKYLDGTFWQDVKTKEYYSLEGMKKKLREDSETEFNRFDGGWGYYYTYIDGDVSTDGVIGYDGKTRRWGIKRNHYYILKVEKIIAPGSPFPGNETMRIHSELLDWVDKGESEVEVKVPQKSEGEEG